MTLEQQRNILELIRLYNSTDGSHIKMRLTIQINKYKIAHKLHTLQLSERIGISYHTLTNITKTKSQYKLDFLTTLIVCDSIGSSISDILA